MKALTRTRIGRFRVEDALSLNAEGKEEQPGTKDEVVSRLIPIREALSFMPVTELQPQEIEGLWQGKEVRESKSEEKTHHQGHEGHQGESKSEEEIHHQDHHGHEGESKRGIEGRLQIIDYRMQNGIEEKQAAGGLVLACDRAGTTLVIARRAGDVLKAVRGIYGRDVEGRVQNTDYRRQNEPVESA